MMTGRVSFEPKNAYLSFSGSGLSSSLGGEMREGMGGVPEDVKMLGIELRKFMLYTLYTWMAAHHSLLVANFTDFLTFCHSFSLN